MPYWPFPSGDDFAYIPVAWAAHDPALYPRDVLVQQCQLLLHAPVWSLLVNGAESTISLVLGFWLSTMALTVGSVLAVLRLMRIAGATGFLLPVGVALAFVTPVGGLGRGAYEGAFGNGLHISGWRCAHFSGVTVPSQLVGVSQPACCSESPFWLTPR